MGFLFCLLRFSNLECLCRISLHFLCNRPRKKKIDVNDLSLFFMLLILNRSGLEPFLFVISLVTFACLKPVERPFFCHSECMFPFPHLVAPLPPHLS